MEDLIMLLNSICPLPTEIEQYLLTVLKNRILFKKEYFLKAGHVNRHLCFIRKGLMRAYYIKDNKEVSAWFLKEGDFIVSIESFYDQKDSYESIQALEDSEIIYIDHSELQFLYLHFNEFNFIGRELTIAYLKKWAQQLYSIRMQTARERYRWLLENEPDLIDRVQAKHIASYLDINEITLSKIKKQINESHLRITNK